MSLLLRLNLAIKLLFVNPFWTGLESAEPIKTVSSRLKIYHLSKIQIFGTKSNRGISNSLPFGNRGQKNFPQ